MITHMKAAEEVGTWRLVHEILAELETTTGTRTKWFRDGDGLNLIKMVVDRDSLVVRGAMEEGDSVVELIGHLQIKANKPYRVHGAWHLKGDAGVARNGLFSLKRKRHREWAGTRWMHGETSPVDWRWYEVTGNNKGGRVLLHFHISSVPRVMANASVDLLLRDISGKERRIERFCSMTMGRKKLSLPVSLYNRLREMTLVFCLDNGTELSPLRITQVPFRVSQWHSIGSISVTFHDENKFNDENDNNVPTVLETWDVFQSVLKSLTDEK